MCFGNVNKSPFCIGMQLKLQWKENENLLDGICEEHCPSPSTAMTISIAIAKHTHLDLLEPRINSITINWCMMAPC